MRELPNHLAVLQALRGGPALSRPDLVRATGLSRPTVTQIVDELLEAGLLEERLAERRATGRPPRLLAPAPRAAYAIGLEVERDHVGWVVCDLAGAAIAGGREWTTEEPGASGGADRDLELLVARVEHALGEAGIGREEVLGVGAAVAAPLSSDGTLHADNLLPGWAGVRPHAAIAERLGLPVVVVNDANAGALGEHTFGAGAGVGDLVYVRLAAGVGAGLLAGGALYTGGAGMAGEIGHVTVVEDGPICRCGNRGCLEAVAGPAALARLLESSTGEPVDVDRLLKLVAAGDRGALRVVVDAGELVGRAIAALVNLVNPRLVVVGGDLAAAGEPLLDSLRRAIERRVSPPVAATVELRLGTLGEQAEVLGAAALVLADAPARLVSRLAA